MSTKGSKPTRADGAPRDWLPLVVSVTTSGMVGKGWGYQNPVKAMAIGEGSSVGTMTLSGSRGPARTTSW